MLFDLPVSRADRMRFFKSYMAHNVDAVNDWKVLAREVAFRTRQRQDEKTGNR